jgi:hypothetical protein
VFVGSLRDNRTRSVAVVIQNGEETTSDVDETRGGDGGEVSDESCRGGSSSGGGRE